MILYTLSSIKDYSERLKPHQLYFILRWGELLSGEATHFRKLLSPSFRAVLQEALSVIENYHSGVLFENNIFEIIQEVRETLKDSFILTQLSQANLGR